MKKVIFDAVSFAGISVMFAVPASAGIAVPAPVAGVGLGALAVLAIGYRAIRKRIDK